MRPSVVALGLALGLAVGCTQNFDSFKVGGSGGDAAYTDAAGSGGADVSNGGQDGGKDATPDAPVDGPSDGPPEGPVCGLGTKLCGAKCVDDTDPAYGCAGQSCAACSIPHATASCDAVGACAVKTCDTGYADCNGNPLDGCETDLQTDPTNCGGCGTNCVEPNATAACTAGKCGVGTCNSGYEDCNTDPVDGCETNTNSDPTACGSCTKDCTQTAGDWVCTNGACKVNTCPAGKGDCDGNSGNGCETDVNTSLLNCGFCGNPCNLPHATATCNAGTCAVASCDAGYKDCDGNAVNGCEVNVTTSAANCGACNRACANTHSTSQSCTAGACTPTCSPGYGDCSSPSAPTADNGCETNLASNANNCGACGRSCDSTHVSSRTCTAGRCDSPCASGWGNCTQPFAPAADNGCETDINTSTGNCGACGRSCSATNVTSLACSGGKCSPTCVSGYDDCNTPTAPAADDGCEASVAFDVNNCGACGRKCSSANVSSRSCSMGKCDSLCQPGYSNCTQPTSGADDGCETHTDSDATNCGACGHQCVSTNASSVACSGGSCAPTCKNGFGDCNTPVAPSADNGCETNTNSSTANCGACGHACSSNHASATSCTGGSCSPTCQGGYSDCNTPSAPAQDNGCESDLSNDPLSCGACGRTCAATHVEGRACSSGVCTSSCVQGYSNCNTPTGTDDGCETANSNTNCGGCGNDCTAQGLTCSGNFCSCTGNSDCGNNGFTDKCSGGVCNCNGSTCKHGEKCGGNPRACHCNGNSGCGNGQVCCQAGCKNIQSDPANCGACGRICAPGFICAGGSCACSTSADCNGGSSGSCSSGICSCGGTTCAAGQRCLRNGSCG